MPVSLERHRAQILAILEGWGIQSANAAAAADGIAWADFRGVKSHGVSKLPGYDVWRRDGRIRVAAAPRIERETPVSALIDGDGGLGYAAGRLAMQTAVALKKRGIEVEELYFHDEGHGFAKEDNRLLYYIELAKFFDTHLKQTPAAGAPASRKAS